MARNRPDDPFEDDWGPGSDAAEPASDEMPEASTDTERTPFLKPFHLLPQREGTLELESVSGSTEYSDVVLHVRAGARKTQFRIGLKNFDPSYKSLLKKFGKKRGDWHGTLRYRIMPHKGRPDGFVAVRPV